MLSSGFTGTNLRILRIDKLNPDDPENRFQLLERVIAEIVP